MIKKGKNWIRDWFDFHKKNIIPDLMSENNPDDFERKLWRFVQFMSKSSYQKGRTTGIDFAIRKFGLDDQELQSEGKDV